MKGGTHQLAFALFAAVNVELYRFDDAVIFGEVFAFGHGETVGLCGDMRQQPNAAKVGRGWARDGKSHSPFSKSQRHTIDLCVPKGRSPRAKE